VAAGAALVRTVNTRLTPAQTIIRLQQGSIPFPIVSGVPSCQVPTASTGEQDECNCTTSTCGAGMVSATGAVAEAVRPFVIATASDTTPGEGDTVTLDGSDTFATSGSTIAAYAWTVVSAAGEEPQITNADQAVASFVAPLGGAITLRLTVTDSEGAEDFADVQVTTPTTAPPTPNGGGGGGGGSLDLASLLMAGALLLTGGIRACAAARRRADPARRASRARGLRARRA
jgi:serine protease